MRLAFICSEFEGLLKTGGLADATRGLATALQQAGHQVQVILPRYGALYGVEQTADWQSLYFDLGHQTYGCAVRHTVVDGIKVALIEHHQFFQRHSISEQDTAGCIPVMVSISTRFRW